MNFKIIKLNREIPLNHTVVEVDSSWIKLLQFVKDHPFSQLTITFREGRPLIVERGIESIKLI